MFIVSINLHCWNNFPIYQLPTKNTNICKFTNDLSMLKQYFFFDDYNVMTTWNLIFSLFWWFIRFSLWRLGFEGLISGLENRRDRPFCYLFSSRKGHHDLFDLKMLRAYVQIRIKLYISARTKDHLFCSKNRKSWGGSDLSNYFYARTWLNTSFLTHVGLSSSSSCAFKNRHPFP